MMGSLEFLRTAAAFLVVLGVLVFIHELGHYLAARWRGVYVEAFSIGFGRTIAGWTDSQGTVWKLGWLPLGGYVKMHGQERPEDVADEVRASWMPGRTFQEKSVLSRAIIVAAGPIANFLLAAVLFSALYAAIGRQVPLAVVGEVVAASSAADAGLRSGDVIRSVDGTKIAVFEDLRRIVAASAGRTLAMQVHRGSQDLTIPVLIKPATPGDMSAGRLGVTAGDVITERLGPIAAIEAGVAQTGIVLWQTLLGLVHIVTTGHGVHELGGPIAIATLSGQVAQLGIASLVGFIAMLSINLGLVNLLPIPILDGGHLMFYAAEALRGRPLPLRAQDYGYRVGFAIIASLFVFISWNDLVHTGAVRWVAHLIG
jgi:regulator of sigma E protease